MNATPNNAPPCYCITLRKAARVLTNGYDAALTDTGLRVTQFSLLANIGRMEPVSFQALSEAILLERTTLVRNLEVLRRQGLIATGQDARAHVLTLTEKGREALAAAIPHWEKAQERANAALSDEERAVLCALLAKMQAAFA